MTESIDKKSALRVAYREVARAISGTAIDSDFMPATVFEGLSVQRGFLDLRGYALSPYDPQSLKKSAPENEGDKASWLAALDAFAGIFKPMPKHMPGMQANIKLFHDYVSSGDYRREEGFDKDAYIVTHDFVRRHFTAAPKFDSDIQYDDEQLDRAKTKHFFYAQRLEGKATIIKMAINEAKDPSALAHMIGSAIGEKQSFEELKYILEDLKNSFQQKGIIMPAELITLLNSENMNAKNLEALKRLFDEDLRNKQIELDRKRVKAEEGRFSGKAKVIEKLYTRHSKIEGKRKRDRLLRRIQLIESDQLTRQLRIEKLKESIKFSEYNSDVINSILNPYKIKIANFIKPKKQTGIQDRSVTIDDLYIQYGENLKKANRVGRQMAQYINAPFSVHLEKFQPDGVLDSGILGGVITNPFGHAAQNPYFQRHEQFGQKLETSITILVDKSGSMAGKKIAMAFIAAERLAYWLSTAGV